MRNHSDVTLPAKQTSFVSRESRRACFSQLTALICERNWSPKKLSERLFRRLDVIFTDFWVCIEEFQLLLMSLRALNWLFETKVSLFHISKVFEFNDIPSRLSFLIRNAWNTFWIITGARFHSTVTFGMWYSMRGHVILDKWHLNWTGN